MVGNENDPEGLKAKKHAKNFPEIYLKQQQECEAPDLIWEKVHVCPIYLFFQPSH